MLFSAEDLGITGRSEGRVVAVGECRGRARGSQRGASAKEMGVWLEIRGDFLEGERPLPSYLLLFFLLLFLGGTFGGLSPPRSRRGIRDFRVVNRGGVGGTSLRGIEATCVSGD